MSVELQLVSYVQKQNGIQWNTDADRNIVSKYAFLLHVLNKNENIVNAEYWVLSQQEKPICPNRKKISSRKTQKNRQSAKINSRKTFVPHNSQPGYEITCFVWPTWLLMQWYCNVVENSTKLKKKRTANKEEMVSVVNVIEKLRRS